MDAWCLRLTTGLLFIATAMTTILVLTESRSSSYDADPATAVHMVDRTHLRARAGMGEYDKGRSTTKYSGVVHGSGTKHHDSFFPSGPDRGVAVQHGRDLTSMFTGEDTNSSANFRAEVEVLIAFKEGITNDSLGGLTSWNSSDSSACGWKGVTCASLSPRVVALDLANLLLEGTINPLLGSLQFLQQVDLSYNDLSGEIPTSLLNCSSLSHVVLGNNKLSGQIPPQLGVLLQLVSLDVSNNSFLAGTFPSSLGNCSLLRVLLLNHTNIGGEVPDSIGQLAQLEILDFSVTSISGTIPASLGNCSSLSQLLMGNANINTLAVLSGELPTEMGSLTRLTLLDILGTKIVGNFPGWVGNNTGLTFLRLDYSSFSGEIPNSLGQLPLEYLALGNNNFTGAIPLTISNCSQLWTLILEYNSFTGVIPPELGSLKKLQNLYLEHNTLSGTIPASLANCSALMYLSLGLNPLMEAQPFPSWIGSLLEIQWLFLHQMNLQGLIPADIGQLSQMLRLGLYNNNLSGQIPPTVGNCTSLQYFDVQDNAMSGEIPPEIWLISGLLILNLGNNFFTGTLSASIGNSSQLMQLQIYINYFTGVIPTEIGSLQNLEAIDLGINNFQGYIPPSIGNLSAITGKIDLSGNYLVVEIPASVGNLSQMNQLSLYQNHLRGPIPVDLMRCTQLIFLELWWNSLDGSIPADIGRLQSLHTLLLSNNHLSGVLPGSFSSSLFALDVSYNALQGVLPPGIFAGISSGLLLWNVSHNLLSGSLPQELAQLAVILNLDFSANNFSGSIPAGLGECEALLALDLSVNNLSGSIPQTLVQLRNLSYLNVSDNKLEGAIPTGGIFATGNLTAASFFGNDGLCGSILGRACPDLAPSGSTAKSTCSGFHCAGIRIAVGCSAAGFVVAILLLVFWLWLYKRKTGGIWADAPGEEVEMVFERGLQLSKEDLMTIISRPENVIAVGAKSTVYKANLTGDRMIAIKTLSILADDADGDYKQVEADLLGEAHTLSKLRHRNILKVLAFFRSRDFVALVSEYMPQGSLDDQLYPSSGECKLKWDARLNIALGAAHALAYLHSHFHEPVIHRDLKPSNVFLDANLQPKLGDFGLARFANPDRDGEKTASTFGGTIGYIPPEYGATTRVSTKGDVYSYGVMLLELMTRRHPIAVEENASGECEHIVDWVFGSFEQNPLVVLDSSLIHESENEECKREQMKLLIRVGLLCTRGEQEDRPQMSDVLGMINQIIQRGSEMIGQPSLAELAEESTAWNTTEALNTANMTSS